jgi:Spy/CpxP family protein refolding chaperone
VLRKIFCSLAMLVLAASTLKAQSSPSNSNSSPNPQMRNGRQGGQEPCFEVAGIQKSTMEQIWSMERETHSQVEAVCSNSSLTPQQKHQQVHELREQAHQKMAGMLTPEQDKALESCRQERGMEHQGMHGDGGGCEGQGQRQGGWQRQGGSQSGSSPNSQNNNSNHWNNSQPSNSSASQN